MLKVLFQSRRSLFTAFGGDTVQIQKTAEALEKLGVQVDLDIKGEANPREFDVVHLFNLMRPQETWIAARRAKEAGKPVVISTIFGPYTELDRAVRRGMVGWMARHVSPDRFELIKILGRWVVNGEYHPGLSRFLLRGVHQAQEDIIAASSVLLPNSQGEAERVKAHFPQAAAKKVVVVPNAVDPELFTQDHHCPACVEVEAAYGNQIVLCAARIESRKCQVELAEAMEGLPWKLVLVGKPGANSGEYYQRLQQTAARTGNCVIAGPVDPQRLPCLYRIARVHALVSWMETPGLSSLEAAASGCQVLITEKGDTYEYFGDMAEYCDPASVESIRQGLIRAYERTPDRPAMASLRERCTWEAAAKATLEGYLQACQ